MVSLIRKINEWRTVPPSILLLFYQQTHPWDWLSMGIFFGKGTKSQPSRLHPPCYLLSLSLLHNWVLMLASIVNTLCIRRGVLHRFTTCVWRNAQSCLSGDSQTNVPLTLYSEILRRALFPPIKAIILFLRREFCIGLTVIKTDKECQWWVFRLTDKLACMNWNVFGWKAARGEWLFTAWSGVDKARNLILRLN